MGMLTRRTLQLWDPPVTASSRPGTGQLVDGPKHGIQQASQSRRLGRDSFRIHASHLLSITHEQPLPSTM